MEALLSKEIIASKQWCRLFAVSVCMVLTALGAFVRVPLPFSPVPVTLQTFFVLLSGALLGRQLAGLAQSGYLVAGFAGVPVFTGAACGLLYLGSPTAGYLIGFLPAALLAGALLRGGRVSFRRAFVSLFAADCLIFGCGILWLKSIAGYSFPQLMLAGVLPFIPGELLKIGAVAGIYRSAGARIQEVLV